MTEIHEKLLGREGKCMTEIHEKLLGSEGKYSAQK